VSVDAEQRRLELALGESEDAGAGEGDRVKGTVIEVLRNGVLVELADGRTGWLPGREVDLPAGTVLAQRFRRGREITARIIEIDVKRGRPILSAKADASAGDRAWQEHSSQGGEAESFGTLADLLRGFKAD